MAKLVLLRLADRADESGICYPSQRRLAAECGITERTVRNAITDLICRGLVIIHTPSTPRGDTTRYLLTFATPESRSGGKPHSGEEQTAPRGGTTFHREGNHVPVTPEPRSAKPSVNHQGTLREPSVDENQSRPECPPDASEPSSATKTPSAKENPATVPSKLRPRPDKVTFQDRGRWSDELRNTQAQISELKLLAVYNRKSDHQQRIANLEHRRAELEVWLDGGTNQ